MDFKWGDRVKVTGLCPVSMLRGQEGIVIGEAQDGSMIEVKVIFPDTPCPLRFYPGELERAAAE